MRLFSNVSFLKTLAGLLVNMSAGWFATLFIVPHVQLKILAIFVNLLYAICSFGLATLIQQQLDEYESE